ncbi:MAG TPA: DNA repair protein RecO C-terminal domain-containing protein, partial [Blastococcus sp.]
CAEPGPHRHFSVPAGGSVCPACRPTGSAMPNPLTIELLDALLTGDWDRAEATQGTNRREGSGLVAALLQWHLERGLRSLPLVDRSDPVAPPRREAGLPL